MKSTGMVRKVDELGRIVLPVELRRNLGIETKEGPEDGSSLEIYVEGEKIILKKYSRGCTFCGECDSLKLLDFKGKTICKDCIEEANVVVGGKE